MLTYQIKITEDQRALIERCLVKFATKFPEGSLIRETTIDLARMMSNEGDSPLQPGNILSDFTPIE